MLLQLASIYASVTVHSELTDMMRRVENMDVLTRDHVHTAATRWNGSAAIIIDNMERLLAADRDHFDLRLDAIKE